MTSSQLELKKEEEDKMLFGNDEIKHKFNDIENETTGKKSSGTKFRKSKKLGGYSTNKYQTRSTAKHSSGMKEELLTASNIFNDLKRKNITFLN